jgi:AcrR family transcriptional regulator
MVKRDTRNAARRAELLEAAARLIATEGAGQLTLRRVAQEVGTSTMAIYTHFGGMPELRHAVRREGFARLARRIAAVEATDDPVADLTLLGIAYYHNAIANADLYRVMFMEQPLDAADAEIGWDTFDALVAGVQRCIDARRFVGPDAADLATQLWALTHGVVSLELAGMLDSARAFNALGVAALNLFIAFGDDRGRAPTSLADGAARGDAVASEARADAS